MATTVREKFSSQAAPEVLAALRRIAEGPGRQFQAVLDTDAASRRRARCTRPRCSGGSIVPAANRLLRRHRGRSGCADGEPGDQRASMQICAKMMKMLESGAFDIAHIDPWLREFATAGD